MKYILLSSGHQVKVDDEDYYDLIKFKWHLSNGYACRHVSTKPDTREYMHRRINNTPKELVTDHINGDKLDNRRSNLRVATVRQNCMNYNRKMGSANPYRGVSIHSKTGLWRARLSLTTIGYFKTPEEAKEVRDSAAQQIYGEFSRVGYL